MAILKHEHAELFTLLHHRNLMRQYDLLLDCMEIVHSQGIRAFDKYMLWALNAAATANISDFGGRYRQCPVFVGNHCPPQYSSVPDEMDRFFSFLYEYWGQDNQPTSMAAYALWRLNWIHPFVDGNGRTARAVCYLMICLRQGRILGGSTNVPEIIRQNPAPYYEALQSADQHWALGSINVSHLTQYLNEVLQQQLDNEREINDARATLSQDQHPDSN